MLIKNTTIKNVILAVARAGSEAMRELSTPDQQVGLKEFTVEVNMHAEITGSLETDISLKWFSLNITEKCTVTVERAMDFSVRMVLAPVPVKEDGSTGGSTGGT